MILIQTIYRPCRRIFIEWHIQSIILFKALLVKELRIPEIYFCLYKLFLNSVNPYRAAQRHT